MEEILQDTKIGKNARLIEGGKLAGSVGVQVGGAALGVLGGGLDGSAIGNSLANIIHKRIYKVKNFCVIHENLEYRNNQDVLRQAESIIDSKYEKGYYKEVLTKLRAALEERFDRGQPTAINEDKDIFTDVELAYYIMCLQKIKDKDIRMAYTVYYKGKYFLVFGKWSMGLVKNIHKNIKFKVKIMKKPTCIIL